MRYSEQKSTKTSHIVDFNININYGQGLHSECKVYEVMIGCNGRDQLDYLDIPYKYRDYCQDNYVEYRQCVRQHSSFLENYVVYFMPFS